MKYILSIDQGTTSSRAIIYDKQGSEVSKAQQEFRQIYPKTGWVEHNPEDIWHSVVSVIQEALDKAAIEAGEIAAIGITNQRETTVVWDKNTGRPIYNAIVWQCRRSTDICQQLKDRGLEGKIKEKTGLVPDPYFSGPKIKWIFDNVEGTRERAEKRELLFGTIDTWLIWKFTGGKVHVTDYTNASRTMLFNIHTLEWDQELLDLLDIPQQMLPEVKDSSSIYGYTAAEEFFGAKAPIAGIAGDQHAATFAQGCFEKGTTKITYGTGGFMLMNTEETAVSSDNGLLTTIAWGLDGEINYALEGSIFNAGSTVQWIRDELCILDDAADSEFFASKVEGTDGVYIVPAFTGLGAPYWDPEARGIIVGISRGSNKNHLIRATLESLVYQSRDVLSAMIEDAKITLKEIKVDGGAAANNFILQFLADMIDTTVERPTNTETTAAGAAFLAGLAVGYWSDKSEVLKIRSVDRVFKPNVNNKIRDELYKGWKRAVATTINWSDWER